MTYRWFHVQDFSNSTLHDQKVRIIDVELNRVKQILNLTLLRNSSIDEILVSTSNDDLQTGHKSNDR